jgi:P27 family predicted phage terminase small subunit
MQPSGRPDFDPAVRLFGSSHMKGRKPNPNAPLLRVIRGENRRHSVKQPLPPADEPPAPPKHLDELAKAEFTRVAALLAGTIGWLDAAVLAIYAQTYSRWVTAEELIATLPTPYLDTPHHNTVLHPAYALARRSAQDCSKYPETLGLTPSSRQRIGPPVPQPRPADPDARYFEDV